MTACVYINVYMYICVFMCTYAKVLVSMKVYMPVNMCNVYTNVWLYMLVCIYAFICIYFFICLCIYVSKSSFYFPLLPHEVSQMESYIKYKLIVSIDDSCCCVFGPYFLLFPTVSVAIV